MCKFAPFFIKKAMQETFCHIKKILAVILGGIILCLAFGPECPTKAADNEAMTESRTAAELLCTVPVSVQAFIPVSEASMEITSMSSASGTSAQPDFRCSGNGRTAFSSLSRHIKVSAQEPEIQYAVSDIFVRQADYFVFALERILI